MSKKHGVYEILLERHDCSVGKTTYVQGWRIWIDGGDYGFHDNKKEAGDRFERISNTRPDFFPREAII